MQRVYLPIKTLSPIAIRSDHAEGGSATASCIPGTTLLGSLAAAHRMLRPERQAEFAQLFLNEQVFFPYLYPALFNRSRVGIDTSISPVMPLPKTAQSCKRFSGFKLLRDEETDEKRHGIRDSLLDWTVFSLLDNEQCAIPVLLVPLDHHTSCVICKQAMDHVGSGYYRRDRRNPELRMKANVSKRLQTRTGINRDWGVVEESILYNREVFDEGMRFWGDIILPDELVSTFMSFLKEANEEKIIHIGTGRTRGLGLVELASDIKRLSFKREGIDTFKTKLDNFNVAVKQQTQDAGVKTLDPFYFAITLYSATILCDPFLRYYKALDAVALGRLLKYPPDTFKKIYQSTGVQCITGWNELWGTPRTNDYAIEMGSTFVFACTQKLDKGLLEALYTLEETGIGRRRSEGFGRICISDPFHLEGEQS